MRVALACALATTVNADVLPANDLPEDVAGQLELMREPPGSDGSLGLALGRPEADWTTLTESSPNFSFDRAAYWVRFRVHNPTEEAIRLIFDVAQPLQDYIDAWVLDATGSPIETWHTGDRRPTSQRPFLYRAFAFPFTVEPGQDITFIARFDTHDGLYDALPMQLVDQPTFFKQKDRESLWFGFYYGAIVILLLYNLVVGLVTRERDFLWYSLYLGCFLVWNLAFRGYLALGPLANAPVVNNMAVGFVGSSIFISLIVFTKRFLYLSERMPRTDLLMVVLAIMMVAPMALSLLDYYALVFSIEIPLALVIMMTVLWVGIYQSWKGYRAGKIYLLAWIFLIVAAFAYYGRVYSLVPSTWLTENALNIGSMIEILVLSLALADRISTFKQQRLDDQAYLIAREQEMNQELKQRVEEKTQAFKQLAERYEQESITDVLTGLRNRRTFDDIVSQTLRHRDRETPWMCLALIDLDHFKTFNDRYGHPAGDDVLEQLGYLLQGFFQRTDDFVFRLGGEEFGVVFRVDSPDAVTEMMDRFQIALADTESLASLAGAEPLTASIGVACVPAGGSMKPADLYSHADQLLYQCKEGGRNQYRVEVIDSPGVDARHLVSE
ncbi:sensor domain-containing diguanylate cyclase [Saccharospirillum salsuginis]|uniref:diguanylate cyclase n=1 Tax=Saccharospirillum salsuginis TaxID=418750 RepID=A0A918K6Z1_9GAMM|nr:diguanylate cyclase [Saccharospirillum salsuginis]GGX48800.1 sensor domain-containing diguanylate cyclase [Saccharospirillum salsuginis]